MPVTHAMTSLKLDGGDASIVRPSDWNAAHVVSDQAFEFVIDGRGDPLTSGIKGDLVMPFTGTFVSWTVLADVAGTIVIDLWLEQYVDYPPTVADTITGSDKPKLTAVIKNTSSALTGWTTAFTKGDILRVYVEPTPATVTRVTLSLAVTEP